MWLMHDSPFLKPACSWCSSLSTAVVMRWRMMRPLGLTYLTNTFNLALNTNTIPHMWKLANIIPIPKPDKDHNTGTSFRPISLLSVISKTLEKALLPYITNNIPQHHTQHGFKAKHSTTTALHNMVVVSTPSRA